MEHVSTANATLLQHLLCPKKAWSPQEDALLQQAVAQFGPQRWSLIARSVPNRLGKQCRERWFNHLDPSINRG